MTRTSARTAVAFTVTGLVVGTTLVGVAGPAAAGVDAKGACSAGSRWEASVDLERRQHELDFEVKSATPGQRWRLVVQHNGKRVYSQVRRAVLTDDVPRAEAQWELRRPDDVNARETFTFRAKNLRTGEVCQATLREA